MEYVCEALRKKPKTEHKMWRLSITSELRKAGTYYLELSDYSSESQKIIKWKAGKVKDITPGEFDIELNEEKPEAYYRLTVMNPGFIMCVL